MASCVKWIETVRQSVAEYCGLIMHIGISERDAETENELFEQIDRCVSDQVTTESYSYDRSENDSTCRYR